MNTINIMKPKTDSLFHHATRQERERVVTEKYREPRHTDGYYLFLCVPHLIKAGIPNDQIAEILQDKTSVSAEFWKRSNAIDLPPELAVRQWIYAMTEGTFGGINGYFVR